MRNLVDLIFSPVLSWLTSIYGHIRSLSIPVSRPLDLGRYLGHLSFMGPQWRLLITTVCTLAFIYLIIYLVRTQAGLFLKFKDFIKWW
jgi:hypothetical protein